MRIPLHEPEIIVVKGEAKPLPPPPPVTPPWVAPKQDPVKDLVRDVMLDNKTWSPLVTPVITDTGCTEAHGAFIQKLIQLGWNPGATVARIISSSPQVTTNPRTWGIIHMHRRYTDPTLGKFYPLAVLWVGSDQPKLETTDNLYLVAPARPYQIIQKEIRDIQQGLMA